MKGLILCAGQGTRLQPFTYARPKCMLPVNGEPVIVSIINKMVHIGICEIGIVINASQGQIPAMLGSGEAYRCSLTYLLQENSLGLADAVKSAYSFIQGEPFLLILGDNLIEGSIMPLIDFLGSEKADASLLLVHVKNPHQFGVADVSINKVVRLEEKSQNPSSDLAVVGAYAFNSDIWKILDRLEPSKRGEYELTDAIQLLIDQGKHVAYCITTEPFFDIGTPERWLDANRYKVSKDSRKQNIKKQLFHSTDTAIISPVHIDPSVKLYQSVIGPYVYIGPGCILNCCRIENSILTDHVQLSHVFVRDSIFGSNVKFSGPVDDTKPAKFIMGDKSKVEE